MKRGYKVLLPRRGKRLFSSFASGSARVEYVPEARAKAPQGTALFIFDSLEDARSYAESMAYLYRRKYEVWACKYRPSRRKVRNVLCKVNKADDVAAFWKDPSSVGPLWKERAPRGTRFASSLMLCDFVCRYYEDGPAEGEWQL